MMLAGRWRSTALALGLVGLTAVLGGCGDSTKPKPNPAPTYSNPQGTWSVAYDNVNVAGTGKIGAYIPGFGLQWFNLTQADLNALAKEVLGVGTQSGWIIHSSSHPLDPTGLGLDPHPHAITLPTPYDEATRTASGSFTLPNNVVNDAVESIVAAYVADIVPVPVTVTVGTFTMTAKYNVQWNDKFTTFAPVGAAKSIELTQVRIVGVVSNSFGAGAIDATFSSVSATANGTRTTKCSECP